MQKVKCEPEIHIGTCGWHYPHWSGPFYPPDVDQRGFLRHYANQFRTVEINNTFYQLPDKETLLRWRETVPSDFLFAVKANRYITHMKKLKDSEEPLARMLEAVCVLGDKLGPILFQLPPRWHVNMKRLRSFLEVLPEQHRYAIEFRDRSWFDSWVYDLLREHEVAFCIHDLARQASPKVITSDVVYVRLHGPSGRYQGRYTQQMIARWAAAIWIWAREQRQIYCYFNNDVGGYATENALELQQTLETLVSGGSH